jgi:uncharacterized membrane protein
MGLLNSEEGSSSMRFTLILTVVGAFLLMVAAAVYIVAAALVSTIAEPSWTEIGIFGVGIASIITGVGYNKVQQKKVEVNGKKPA